MIKHPAFNVEPWAVRERSLDLDLLAQAESVFALSNGHIGLRGNLDEGEPYGQPGTYLNSVYEQRPLPYAEAGYGYPESGQTVVNVTNGKLIRLLVDDEPFDVRYGTLHEHERVLDLRAGTLTRRARWSSPTGAEVLVTSTRLVSFTHRAVAAIHYEVEAVGHVRGVVVQSELVANETVDYSGDDPRAAAMLTSPLVLEENSSVDGVAVMVHSTKASGLRVAAAMCHDIDGPDDMRVETDGGGDVSRVTVATRLEPGERLRLVKFFSYGWSARRSRPALHDQVVAALAAARLVGWDGLCAEQRRFLDRFWAGADVEVEGDPEVQQAVRFALFHLVQAAARLEDRPIPAKGLTGSGYDGHAFWDTEIFVLPVLTYTYPRAARDALAWRKSILSKAEERAAQLGAPLAAPRHGVVLGPAPPGGFGGAEVGPAGHALVHQKAQLLQPVAEAFLEDRHHAPPRLPLGRGQRVDLGQRADQRLLTKGVLAGREHPVDLLEMQVRRRANIDDVQLVHAAQLADIGGNAPDSVLLGQLAGAAEVDVANGAQLVLLGQPAVGLDVRPADATAHHGPA